MGIVLGLKWSYFNHGRLEWFDAWELLIQDGGNKRKSVRMAGVTWELCGVSYY